MLTAYKTLANTVLLEFIQFYFTSTITTRHLYVYILYATAFCPTKRSSATIKGFLVWYDSGIRTHDKIPLLLDAIITGKYIHTVTIRWFSNGLWYDKTNTEQNNGVLPRWYDRKTHTLNDKLLKSWNSTSAQIYFKSLLSYNVSIYNFYSLRECQKKYSCKRLKEQCIRKMNWPDKSNKCCKWGKNRDDSEYWLKKKKSG